MNVSTTSPRRARHRSHTTRLIATILCGALVGLVGATPTSADAPSVASRVQRLDWPPGGDLPILDPWSAADLNLADLVVASISTGFDYDASGQRSFSSMSRY